MHGVAFGIKLVICQKVFRVNLVCIMHPFDHGYAGMKS